MSKKEKRPKPKYIENSGEFCKFCGEKAHYQFKDGTWSCEFLTNKCPAKIKKQIESYKRKSKPQYIENSKYICKYCENKAHYQFKSGNWCCENNISKCPGGKKKIKESLIGRPYLKLKYIKDSKHVCKFCGEKAHYQFKDGTWCCKEHSNKCPMRRKEIGEEGTYSLKDFQKRYPIFCKVEELREDPNTKKIQAHCKNHNCKNSKELGGWFIPNINQIYFRCYAIESKNGNGASYIYCSEYCKQTCSLYHKTVEQIMRQDLINAGHLPENILGIPGYEIWRNEVYKRNKELFQGVIQCEICGEIEDLIAHHIYPQKSHPEQSLDPNNGIIVCQKCHFEKCHPKGTQCSFRELAKLICEKRFRNNKKEKL